MNSKTGESKDVVVQRAKVGKALYWLIQNNSQNQNIEIDLKSLNSLPISGIPEHL